MDVALWGDLAPGWEVGFGWTLELSQKTCQHATMPHKNGIFLGVCFYPCHICS